MNGERGNMLGLNNFDDDESINDIEDDEDEGDEDESSSSTDRKSI